MTTPLRIGRLRVYTEAAGSATFGVDASASIASFKDVQHKSAAFTRDQVMSRNEALVQRPFYEFLDILGPKSCTLNLETDLTPTGSPITPTFYAGSPPSAPTFALGTILHAIFGGYRTNEGSTESGVDAIGTVTVGTGHGSRWTKGSVIGVVSSGGVHARQVQSIATDTISFATPLAAVTTSGSAVYGAHTFYLTDDPNTSLQFVVEEADRENIWWLRGMQSAGFTLTLNLAQLWGMSLNLKGVAWDHDDDVASPLGGSALSAATLTDGEPIHGIDGQVWMEYGSSCVPADVSAVSVTIKLNFEPLPSLAGVNGAVRWKLKLEPPQVEAQFTVPATDSAGLFNIIREAREILPIGIQCGNTAGKIAYIGLPRCQVTNIQHADYAGQYGLQVNLKALENDADTTTELGRSPVVLAFL